MRGESEVQIAPYPQQDWGGEGSIIITLRAGKFGRATGLESMGHQRKQILPHIVPRQTYVPAADTLHHPSRDAEQTLPDRADFGLLQFRSYQGRATNMFHQHIRQSGQQHPKHVRQKRMTTRTIREESELLLLDPILTVTALTVDILVHRLGIAAQVGHDVTRVRFTSLGAPQMFGLYDDASRAIPTFGGIRNRAKHAMALTINLMRGPHLSEPLRRHPFQHRVPRQPKNVANIVLVAPSHQPPAAETAVATNQDFDTWPRLT